MQTSFAQGAAALLDRQPPIEGTIVVGNMGPTHYPDIARPYVTGVAARPAPTGTKLTLAEVVAASRALDTDFVADGHVAGDA
jgi:hypothetical protein